MRPKQIHRGVRARLGHIDVPIADLSTQAYLIPTERPESDGTLQWHHTTLVVVEASAGGQRGLGYSYADVSTANLIQEMLADVVVGQDAMAVSDCWLAMVEAIRNLGRPGIASMAISAVDAALWDLKARLLNLPLVSLLGRVRDGVPIYGSGGFTCYSIKELQDQMSGCANDRFQYVKMKVGRDPGGDPERVRAAREAIGRGIDLFIDANGAYGRKQALMLAETFVESGVRWFEEPVSSDDLEGLRLIRDQGPAGMDITAGEYGYDLFYFRRMLEAGAVDVLQADATRCGGITGFLQAAALCHAQPIPLSAHCGPSIHVHPGCALTPVRHIECFTITFVLNGCSLMGRLFLFTGSYIPTLHVRAWDWN